MFVTITDFDSLEYSLPKFEDYGTAVTSFINKREEENLRKLIGNKLYDAFIEGLEALPGVYSSTVATVIGTDYVYGNSIWKALTITTGVLPVAGTDWQLVEEENKWLLLKNGVSFDYEENNIEKRYVWVGMQKMLTPLLYSEVLELTYRKPTAVGMSISKAENARIVRPTYEVVRGWNDFVDLANFMKKFLESNEEDYPDLEWGYPNHRNIYGI
jgi:hypothetical protein